MEALDKQSLFVRQINRDYQFAKGVQLSRMCIELIHICMSPEPKDRPSARAILCTNWLAPKSSPLAVTSRTVVGSGIRYSKTSRITSNIKYGCKYA